MIIGMAAVFFVGFVVLLHHYVDTGDMPMHYVSQKAKQAIADDDSSDTENYTAIPGFDFLYFRAGKLTQTARLYNPAQNHCYFQIRIILPNGQEIYNSDMLAPGESVKRITLNTSLAAGTYEGAVAQYNCYSLDELKSINGATVKFTLEVR